MRLAMSCMGLLFCLALAAGCVVGAGLLVSVAVFCTPAIDPVTPPANANIVVPITPVCPDCKPTPTPAPTPPRRPKPWGDLVEQSVGLPRRGNGNLVHDGSIHDGQEVQIDLPADILKRNIASKGLGCCVFRSINYCGLWQNVPEVIDLPEQMVKANIEGGGYPEKVDRIMKQFAPGVKYIQVQNGDWDVVKLALKTGRCVAITYGSAHMVCLVKLDNGVGCFRDNNLTGEKELIWGTEQAVKSQAGGNHFWAVILLNPRPPAPPHSTTPNVIVADTPANSVEKPPRLNGQYEWKHCPNEEGQFALFCNSLQVGNFSSTEDYYREYLGGDRWGKRYHRPPVPLPEDALNQLEAMPAGVTAGAWGNETRYSICGQEISRHQVQAVLEDDSTKLSLTVIGDPAETAAIKADLDKPENAYLKQRCLLQVYTRDNWAVNSQRYGFDTSGHPTIQLETSTGDMLWHTNAYEGKNTLVALRKADPNYRPENDPGMPKPAVAAPGMDAWGNAAIIAGVLGGGIFLIGVMALAGVVFLHIVAAFTKGQTP